MIISHKYKFIFIKTAKTAGTSIEVFLSQHCGETDVVTPIDPPLEPHVARNYKGIWNPFRDILACRGRGIKAAWIRFLHQEKFYNHIPAHLVQKRVPPEIWEEYFKFCVERNPWDKIISHYYMLNERRGGNIPFERYIRSGAWKFCINYPRYTDRQGNVIVDEVIKYESLISGLTRVFTTLGIPFDGDLGVRAKSGYRKDYGPYQKFFSIEQREVIEKAFKVEIELHGYTF